MRNVIPNQAQRYCYRAGREARDLDKDKTPPGGLGAQRRSYWLAGYSDRDIELKVAADRELDARMIELSKVMIFGGSIEIFTSTRSEP